MSDRNDNDNFDDVYLLYLEGNAYVTCVFICVTQFSIALLMRDYSACSFFLVTVHIKYDYIMKKFRSVVVGGSESYFDCFNVFMSN